MDGDRLSRTFRTWRKLSDGFVSLDRKSWWRSTGSGAMGFALSSLALGASVIVEAALWEVEWSPASMLDFGRLPGVVVATLFFGTWLVGAWVFDGLCHRKLAEPSPPALVYRCLRAVVLSFPGFGLTTVPLWSRIASEAPALAYPSRLAEAGKSRAPGTLGKGWGRASGRGGVLTWIAGAVTLFVALLWLADAGPSHSGSRVLLWVAMVLHLLGFGGTVRFLRKDPSFDGSRPSWTWAIAWLLPLPLTLIALMPLGIERWNRRTETLTWTAFSRRGGSEELADWRQLEAMVRGQWASLPWWRRWGRPIVRRASPKLSVSDRELHHQARIKLWLLLGDGLVVGWILHRAGFSLVRPPWIGLCAVIAIGSGVIGAVVCIGRLFLTVIGLAREPGPFGVHRQVGAGAFGVAWLDLGLLSGSGFASGDHRESGLFLVHGVALVVMIVGLTMILRSGIVSWAPGGNASPVSVCALSVPLMLAAGLAAMEPLGRATVVAVAIAIPVLHAAYFVLARPFLSWVFESASGGRGGPARAMWLTTALLPLGGLAVPAWLGLRDRTMGRARRGGTP